MNGLLDLYDPIWEGRQDGLVNMCWPQFELLATDVHHITATKGELYPLFGSTHMLAASNLW